MNAKDALAQTRQLPPQTRVDVTEGMSVRRSKQGTPVVRLHYTVIPDRRTAEWKRAERAKYTTQAGWDREQEIIDNAGGGELVFADVLLTHWSKIVITNPEWRPSPAWAMEGGFDHGKTNPTALTRAVIDHDGVVIFCGEYYMPGLEVWQHAPRIKQLAEINKMRACYADPTIFDATMQQSNQPSRTGGAAERAKSINELYVEQGIELFSPFWGDRSDISFAARLMAHWANLDKREPTVKIVCRNYSERPQPGLHNWDCPNLLWELMRTRRVKLSAQQLMSRNVAEAIVDKDNHERDAAKYLLMSHPEPTARSARERAAIAVAPLAEAGDLTSALIRAQDVLHDEAQAEKPVRLGRRGRRR